MPTHLNHLFHERPGILITLGMLLVALSCGSLIRIFRARDASDAERQMRLASLQTWWILILLFALAVILGRGAAILVVATLSSLALWEFVELNRLRTQDRGAWVWLFAAAGATYLSIYLGWLGLYSLFLLVGFFWALTIHVMLAGPPCDFLQTAANLFWGAMATVFSLSHAALLCALPEESNAVGGPLGWFVYLLVLNSVNDVSQALWGKQVGRKKITPVLSPHKTWAGFLLGAATTTLVAVVLAPLLTPFFAQPVAGGYFGVVASWLTSAFTGMVIAVSGFFGDISMSALKRDLGVKNSGVLLPGQGGVIDRIDSLTLSSPVFFYFVWIFYG